MSDIKAIIDWAKTVLGIENCDVQMVVKTPYSHVLKLTNNSDVFYLKIVPPTYFVEVDILEILIGISKSQSVPEIIFKNKDFNAFITKSCGDMTLRQYFFENGVDIDLMKNGLSLYQEIQSTTQNKINDLALVGIPDWRLNKFPEYYCDLINDPYFMTLWGIDYGMQKDLLEKEVLVNSMCKKLNSFNLPDTLNHCDWHNNNILINTSDKSLRIIDWGESSIGNPILSVEPFFRSLRKHHKIERGDKAYVDLQNHYFNCWGLPADEIRPILNCLGNIYFAFCMKNVIQLTRNDFSKWAHEIKKAFIDFLYFQNDKT